MRWFVLAAVLFPVVDLSALIALGGQIGGLHALGYALFGVVAGVLLTRSEGLRVLFRLRESLSGGEPPTDGVLSGILVVVGGLLLALPGPLSDVLGLALFVPPLRRGLAAWLRARIERRFAASTVQLRAVRVEGMPFGGLVDLGGVVDLGGAVDLGAALDLGGALDLGRGQAAPLGAPRSAPRGGSRAPRGRAAPGGIIETEGEVVDGDDDAPPRLPG